jgi:hypothetical protein
MAFDPTVAAKYGAIVQLVVDMYERDKTNLTPAVDGRLGAAEFDLVAHIQAVDHFAERKELQFYGLVARARGDSPAIVVAIRGTESPIEDLIDLEAVPRRFPMIADAGEVEDGFLSVFQSLAIAPATGGASSLDEFLGTFAADQIVKLIFTGHSLGAAVATMAATAAAARFAPLAPRVSLYTIASPAVGDQAFATEVDARVPNHFRVWNEHDIVPRLPPFYKQSAGAGIELKPTVDQYTRIRRNPVCQHELKTYLWLLDPQTFPLAPECSAPRGMGAV